MKWLNKKEEKTKLEFTAKNRRKDTVNRTIKLHLELDMQYSDRIDIVQAIRQTKTNFELPPGIDLLDAHLAHVEILGDPNAGK
jgi:hypothetical protein